MSIKDRLNILSQLHYSKDIDGAIEFVFNAMPHKYKSKYKNNINHIIYLISFDLYDILLDANPSDNLSMLSDTIDNLTRDYIYNKFNIPQVKNLNDRLLDQINYILNTQDNT